MPAHSLTQPNESCTNDITAGTRRTDRQTDKPQTGHNQRPRHVSIHTALDEHADTSEEHPDANKTAHRTRHTSRTQLCSVYSQVVLRCGPSWSFRAVQKRAQDRVGKRLSFREPSSTNAPAPPASSFGSRRDLQVMAATTPLPGATYIPALLGPEATRQLFEATTQLPFPVRNRGITRAEGAPKVAAFNLDGSSTTADDFGDELPSPVIEIARALAERKLLRKAGRQCSVNLYDKPSYCMVPHKDGYSEQAAIVSLGSDSVLEFWHEPMTDEERLGRDLLHSQTSGTAVYENCLDQPSQCAMWMEPGSVLLLEGAALCDFAHGIRARREDIFEESTVSNAQLVSRSGLCERIARDPVPQEAAASMVVPRRQRATVVFWTSYVPGAATAHRCTALDNITFNEPVARDS